MGCNTRDLPAGPGCQSGGGEAGVGLSTWSVCAVGAVGNGVTRGSVEAPDSSGVEDSRGDRTSTNGMAISKSAEAANIPASTGINSRLLWGQGG